MRGYFETQVNTFFTGMHAWRNTVQTRKSSMFSHYNII